MLQQPFYVVNGGSQIAIFVAEEDAEILVQLATEEELPKEEETSASSSSTSTELLHSCQSCKCSFFLQEEMVSHFESLHPEEVHQCTICEEKICGPVQEKHMELHRALEAGATRCLCELCGKVYKDKGIMRGHLKAVHFPSVEIAMLTCEFCGLTFTKTAKLTAHRIRYHDPKVPCKKEQELLQDSRVSFKRFQKPPIDGKSESLEEPMEELQSLQDEWQAKNMYQYRLGLAVINVGADEAKIQEIITEKVTRVMEHIKKRFASKEEKVKTSTNTLLHSCQSCKCSFFLQEEMVSHFESLHPEEVHQCIVCEEKICGPWQMHEKHMELHRTLEEGQTDELLSNLGVPSGSTKVFLPEFVVVELGDYKPHHLKQKTDEIFQSKFLITIRGNVWIKPDMKDRLSHFLEIFVSKIKLHLNEVQKPKISQLMNPSRKRIQLKVECDVCGKKMIKKNLEGHINSKHNPERVQCCHCRVKYLTCNESSHIETHHNGGKNLLCKICDSKFSESGDNQPHMTPKSNFPFKCPTKRCRKAFQSENTLEKHMQAIHKDTPPCLCELCGKQYKDKANLKVHLQALHFPRKSVYTCEICGAIYSVLTSFRHHKFTHEPKATCEICGIKVNKRHLVNHMKIHTEKPSIPCKYCGRLFSTRLNCTLHEQKRHEGVKLYCSICTGLTFKSVQSLEKHNLKHERGEEIILPKNLRPVQCSICSEMLGNAQKLSMHMNRHKKTGISGILPKQTTRVRASQEDCRDRGYTIPCYACLLRFMTQKSYDQHIETHHPDGAPEVYTKPPDSDFRYQCRYCEKTFRKKDFCNDHETLHGGEKQHACNFCGKKYSYYADKWAHQNRKCPKRPQTSGSN
ncbi:hypothetical protein B566_EDAN007291 [Ephemera danica]|nr:hypothetical protein B566_EDAN007291 [Ephemera danica]